MKRKLLLFTIFIIGFVFVFSGCPLLTGTQTPCDVCKPPSKTMQNHQGQCLAIIVAAKHWPIFLLCFL
ncbi:hypothetical protein [Acetobacterium malicum]|uniref:Lipoprotein n=1 Tax=Acetobacterium malicum TaxID=52692 RepID=A0ABR6YYZ5_9FIRM|nr:hypothetical protein [Acetobacterium malicum]MBC3900467.1 hypothetical protein [Acetobacterium malicum]